MKLIFNAISESLPGIKWQRLFNERWPSYKTWLKSDTSWKASGKGTSLQALKAYMPELVNTHQQLCHLVNADEEIAGFLTGFQPPTYYSACSQAVSTLDSIRLIRNYDYYPNQIEGTLLFTAWNGKKVIANTDCLMGVLDGMNEDGLAVSLTFGGRKVMGFGFGIPFILRYVLEFCSTVMEAVEVLMRIPTHMSYNVTLADRSGRFKTLQLAPDRMALVTDLPFATNHQSLVEWPENAVFNQTIERAAFLEKVLSKNDQDSESITELFLHPPLFNTQYKEGLGTLYTAIYHPKEGAVELRWPEEKMTQSFYNFQEESRLIEFDSNPPSPIQKSDNAFSLIL